MKIWIGEFFVALVICQLFRDSSIFHHILGIESQCTQFNEKVILCSFWPFCNHVLDTKQQQNKPAAQAAGLDPS